jgi:hypothetical protein
VLVGGGFCLGGNRQKPAHGLAIQRQLAGNPAFGPALLMQGGDRILLIHFDSSPHCVRNPR